MRTPKFLFLFLVFLIGKTSFAQDNPVILEYINAYKEIAISEMQRTGVPAAIKLAQGIHETEAGTSALVKKSNNHFGIKCKSDWEGKSVKHTDDAPNECFRKYNSSFDSYKDHSDFLKNSSRYASLFELDPTDYEAWAWGLRKAGYATNTRYPQIIIKLINEYHLQDYTMIALGKMNPGDAILAKVKTETKNEPVALPAVYNEEKITEPEYSATGEFKINETRVVFIKKGTSFLSIAEKYNLPLARLFEFNDIKEQEFTDKDQLVYIMRKRKTGNSEQHIVKQGESLIDVAQSQAIRLESLLEYNYLKPGMQPAVGSVLYLRAKAPAMPALAVGSR
jgi:mannosyl-glycoprotein endo-beta-N-acetylglucosaminidase/LysM domain-containing protein